MYKQNDSFMNSDGFFMTLSDHIVLQSDSMETDAFMDAMEAISILPITVTWYGSNELMNRLYHLPDTDTLSRPLDIELGKLRLVMLNGSNKGVVMSPLHPTASKFKWIAGRSFNDTCPAQLPTSILGLLFHLAYITSINLLKEDVIKLMNSFKTVEYN